MAGDVCEELHDVSNAGTFGTHGAVSILGDVIMICGDSVSSDPDIFSSGQDQHRRRFGN